MESFHEAWDLICDYCKAHITDVAYKTWISRIEPVKLDFDAGDAILMVPNEFHRQTLNRCYMPLLNSAVHEIFGSGINIIFTIPNEAGEKKAAPNDNLAINSEYEFTFDTYIVGSSNSLPTPPRWRWRLIRPAPTTPLFIYGNSGLGKTHLLYAICNDLEARPPGDDHPVHKGRRFHQRADRRDPAWDNLHLSSEIPENRRASGRRHPIYRRQGFHPGGIFPYL